MECFHCDATLEVARHELYFEFYHKGTSNAGSAVYFDCIVCKNKARVNCGPHDDMVFKWGELKSKEDRSDS